MAAPVAFAVAAHPDDIEFMMAGTLLRLAEAGYDLHYMNIANGCCGTATHSKRDIVRIRTAEAKAAASRMGAVFHPPLADDLDIFYEPRLLRKVAAAVRRADPTILLVPSPDDYMEDHMNAARLAVSAAFFRPMKNYRTDPVIQPVARDCAVYHALPYGLRDGMNRPVRPDRVANIAGVIDEKTEILALHKSQKEWLDHSQGLDAYLTTMRDMSAAVGRMAQPAAPFGEGWRQHNPLGLGPEGFDPLGEALGESLLDCE